MPREIVLGNGRMTVLLDNQLKIRDFFFPNVGLENHLVGHKFRIGVWADGHFSWVGEDWKVSMRYLPETLVGRFQAGSKELEIDLEINDAVHHFHNIYLRKVTVTNRGNQNREIRVFFSQDFHIYGEDTGDTAMYEPTLRALVHYKRQRYFLINGTAEDGAGLSQFSTGYKESFGREGTWKDAEDGILEGNPIAQGSVDSAVSFKLDLGPGEVKTLYYWIACGKGLPEVRDLDSKVRGIGVEQMLVETENYWSAWVNNGEVNLSLLPRDVIRMFKTSLLLMRTHVDHQGAIVASCDYDVLLFNRDTYGYLWPRDGAIAAMAFDLAGFEEVARSFFVFCNRVITAEGYFYHKYSPDGSVGSSWHPLVDPSGRPQLPIQMDETALVLLALWRHFRKNRHLEFIGEVYANLVVRASDFLLSHRDPKTGLPDPSYDLWEEKRGVFTSTSAAICAALFSAAKFAKVFYDSRRQAVLAEAAQSMKQAMLDHLYDRRLGRFLLGTYPDGSVDPRIDSSLSFVFTSGVFDPNEEVVQNTMKAVVDNLWINSEIGGLARYENDRYHLTRKNIPGNPWFVCTLWLARWHIARAKSLDELKPGLDLLTWTVRRALSSGVLAEQVDPIQGTALSASPLIWSHAEFIIAVSEYLAKYEGLKP